MKSCNYYWRLLATGFCFFYFGFLGLVFGITLFPLLYVFFPKVKVRQKAARYILRKLLYSFLQLMQLLGIMESEVINKERLQESQGMIIIANHPSLIDVIFLISLVKDATCIVKQAVWNNPCMLSAVRTARYISNDNPVALVDECVARLAEGEPLLIFPEGTRSKAGRLNKFQRGAANIAILGNAPIRPVHISVKPTTLTKAERWYQIPYKKFKVTISVGEVIDISPIVLSSKNSTIAARNITAFLEDYYVNSKEIRNENE